jgi:succinate-semialdehyde dehydrogenase/glutarate-semialdehyde dehydrogenase
MKMLKSINPATEEVINSFKIMETSEIESVINSVDSAFEKWSTNHFELRSNLMQKAAGVLRDEKENYSKLMTEEMGKPINQSRAEVEKCAWVCEYYAENAKRFLSDEMISTDASKSFVTFQPLGVVLAVMPWNFPFWQVFRFAAPGLMSGNGGILKHASNVSGCALAIEDVFVKAGFPENIFRSILLPSLQMESVIKNEKIKAVTLTGSVPAGKSVAQTAGSVLKKTVMELGGSDPYLILKNADLELAADTCVTSRLINGGQSCIAAKRFIVVESVFDEFEKLFIEKMNSKKWVILSMSKMIWVLRQA